MSKSAPNLSEGKALPDAREVRFLDVMTMLAQQKWTILGITLLVAAAAALYTFLAKPQYEASALILVDKGERNALPFADLTTNGTSTWLANELETLRSRAVAEVVARRLLEREYVDSARRNRLMITAGKEEGEPAPVSEVVRRIQKSIEVTPIRESDVIRITARSPGQLEAPLIISTYLEAFNERNRDMSLERTRAAREFLEAQLRAKHQALNEKDSALQAYMHRSNVVSLDDETRRMVEQMAQLEASRGALEIEISARQKTFAEYKDELRRLEPNVARTMGDYGDAYIRLLQDQLARLEVQRDMVISQNFGPGRNGTDSEQIRGLDTQMAMLKKKLQERTKSYLSSMTPSTTRTSGQEDGMGYLGEMKQKIVEERIALDGLLARKQALDRVLASTEGQFNSLPRKIIDLAKLQRARLSSEKLYLAVEEKYNEAAIKERSEFADAAVIDPPSVPDEPVSPRKLFNLLVGLAAGFALGTVVAVIRSAVDPRLHSPSDISRRGYKLYATIRRVSWIRKNAKKRSGILDDGRWYDTSLIPLFHPFDPATESFRHLLTALVHSGEQKAPKRIMVTSANPGEGKTMVVANLAVTAAQLRRRVLLIDVDLRRPTLHKLFNIVPSPGLSDYIRGTNRFDEVVRINVLENLDVICCGTEVENSARILTSWRLREFLDKLAPAYDLFLFDTPPLLAVSDPAFLCASMDITLVVASGGQTRIDQLDRVMETLRTAGAPALGVVFNNYDARRDTGSSDLYGYSTYSYTTSDRPKKLPPAVHKLG